MKVVVWLGEMLIRENLMDNEELSLDAWIFHLEQGDSDNLASMASKYVTAKGSCGESSFLLASNMRAFKALACLFTVAEEDIKQEELEKILYTVIYEADNPLCFTCFRAIVELSIKQAEYNNVSLYSHISIATALDIAKACKSYRIMLYLSSVLNDISLLSSCPCFSEPNSMHHLLIDNQKEETYTIDAPHLHNLERLVHIIEELTKARDAPIPNIQRLSLINNILIFLQSIIDCQHVNTIFSKIQETIDQLKQYDIPDTPESAILYTLLNSTLELCKKNDTEINQVIVSDDTINQNHCIDIPHQSSSSSSCCMSFINEKISNINISSYIKTLNAKICTYELEILKLNKQIEGIRYRHREEAEINGKLNEALSEQLREEIDRGLLLEKQSLEKDRIILSLRELLKVWTTDFNMLQNSARNTNYRLYPDNNELELYNGDNRKLLNTDVNAIFSSNLIESATLTEKYIESMSNSLIDINDSLKRLENERQSISMLQKHVIGLEYERDQSLDNRADLDTELLRAELRRYRRVYFSLKAHYEAMINFLPEATADLANDVLSNLVVDENNKEKEYYKNNHGKNTELNNEIELSSQSFIDYESAWNENNSAWRRYMTDDEYKRYVERAVTPTGLSTMFQCQVTTGPDSKLTKARPWSAVLYGKKKEKCTQASKSFY